MLARPWLLATPPAPVSWGPMAMTVVLSHLTQAHCHLALTLLQSPSPKLSDAESQLVPPTATVRPSAWGLPPSQCKLVAWHKEAESSKGRKGWEPSTRPPAQQAASGD